MAAAIYPLTSLAAARLYGFAHAWCGDIPDARLLPFVVMGIRRHELVAPPMFYSYVLACPADGLVNNPTVAKAGTADSEFVKVASKSAHILNMTKSKKIMTYFWVSFIVTVHGVVK